MGVRLTRRAFLASMPAAARAAEPEKGQVFPSDQRRYPDPATEFDVFRLTDPAYSSSLPAQYNRAISQRGGFLLLSCDRTGSSQVFRFEVKTGQMRQLTAADALDPASPTLMPDERSFLYVDGASVKQCLLANLREREVYRVPSGWKCGEGFALSEDGVHALLAERRESRHRIRLIATARGTAATVAEADEPVSHPVPRPRRAGILYRRGDSLWIVNYDGQQNRRLRTEPGGLATALWSADGRTVLYLNVPAERTRLNNLRELTPDTNSDKLISTTSQFISFARNRDSSVFIGASSNKASPHLLLLLRVTHRELTLCEHRASDPAAVAPVFAPNSQRIYFHSDRHGKPAIYAMTVDRFVERTES